MNREAKETRKIPRDSLILPRLIRFVIPGFESLAEPIVPNVLSPKADDSREWFNQFVDIVLSHIGKSYLPIMRMSDGEYQFILGNRPKYHYGNPYRYLRSMISYWYRRTFPKKSFQPSTLPSVSSGDYSLGEIETISTKYAEWIYSLSQKGILALHLTYAEKPFQEHYHRDLMKWFKKYDIKINDRNYFPFYFVYALLRGEQRSMLFTARNILVVHSARDKKRIQIIKSLKQEGAKNIEWLAISPSRSLFDSIDVTAYIGNVDLALVGAGVGKPNILLQLEPLNVPCIDAGFVFEVWADERNKFRRPFMICDTEK